MKEIDIKNENKNPRVMHINSSHLNKSLKNRKKYPSIERIKRNTVYVMRHLDITWNSMLMQARDKEKRKSMCISVYMCVWIFISMT